MSREAFIAAAKAYCGSLWHVPTGTTELVISDLIRGSVANDFLLAFAKTDIIPPHIRTEATRRINEGKALAKSNTVDRETEGNMCCWEYVLLALFDADLLSREKMERLIGTGSDLVYALYQEPLSQYELYNNQNKQPAPGDILLFQHGRQERPWHAAISIDNKGTYIDLVAETTAIKQLTGVKKSAVYIIPYEKIIKNIDDFLARNPQSNSFGACTEQLIENLKYSQYRAFLRTPEEQKAYDEYLRVTQLQNQLYSKLVTFYLKIGNYIADYEKSDAEITMFLQKPSSLCFRNTYQLIESFYENEAFFTLVDKLNNSLVTEQKAPNDELMKQYIRFVEPPSTTSKTTVNFIARAETNVTCPSSKMKISNEMDSLSI